MISTCKSHGIIMEMDCIGRLQTLRIYTCHSSNFPISAKNLIVYFQITYRCPAIGSRNLSPDWLAFPHAIAALSLRVHNARFTFR